MGDSAFVNIPLIRRQLESLSLPRRSPAAAPIRPKPWPVAHLRDIACVIEHTLLKPEATRSQIASLCDEAMRYRLHGVCVNPIFVEEASRRLSGSDCKVVIVIGFPLGANLIGAKVEETRQVIALGAQEIDMVLPVGLLKAAEYEAVFQHIGAVVEATRPLPVKVILETSLLSQSEKVIACFLSDWAGATFVKTSTGFGSKGATSEDVKLMRSVISDRMGIKAAGGIGSLDKALEMLAAGADRIGASGSVKIMEEALAKEALRA